MPPEQTDERLKLAYGLLWLIEIDTRTRNGRLASQARRLLLPLLTQADQALGIDAARRGQLRRCESNLVDPDGSCLACGADQGVACRRSALDEPGLATESRQNPRTGAPLARRPLNPNPNLRGS